MVNLNLLTKNENRVLNKKLNNKKLTQIEANYLSRSIRPKLRDLEKIRQINISSILQRIQYNQKGLSIEIKIKELIKKSIKELDSIILYGSVIQTNYYSYKDIDVLILTKKKLCNKLKEKYSLIRMIKKQAQDMGLILDIQIMERKQFYLEYPSSPDLIYQLKDCKVICGNIKIPNKIKLYNINLQMKLDWSYVDNPGEGIEIYRAIRNTLLVRLLLNGVVDNQKLKESLNDEIGQNLVERLKNNQASKIEKKIALNYLKELAEKTRQELGGVSWERIAL